MSKEDCTGLDASWESSIGKNCQTAPADSHCGSVSPNSNYCTLANNALPSFSPPDLVYAGPPDKPQNTSSPFASLNFLDGYNLGNQALGREVDERENSHRHRMSSTTFYPPPPRYTLNDAKRYSTPNMQSNTPEEYLNWNSEPHASAHLTSHSYPSCREAPPPAQYRLTSSEEANYGHHNLGYPTGAHSEVYQPIMIDNLRASMQPPAYCLDRPYKCDKCGSCFSRNHDLKRHARIHLAVKPFPCGWCDKAFSRKDALKRHLLVKGCSKKKDVSIEESLQNSEKLKALQERSVLPSNFRRDQLSKPSSVSMQRDSSGDESHSPRSTQSGFYSTRGENPSIFNQIKLQNITCSVPTYI